MTGDPMTAGLRQLAEALRAAASAVDLIADAVSGTAPDTDRPARRAELPAHRPARADSRADITADTGTPDAETVVAALWPLGAVTLARDVEAKSNGRYRGRVRWRDASARGGYRGHSRTFGTEAAAWAWVRTWTAPPVASSPAARDASATAPVDGSEAS